MISALALMNSHIAFDPAGCEVKNLILWWSMIWELSGFPCKPIRPQYWHFSVSFFQLETIATGNNRRCHDARLWKGLLGWTLWQGGHLAGGDDVAWWVGGWWVEYCLVGGWWWYCLVCGGLKPVVCGRPRCPQDPNFTTSLANIEEMIVIMIIIASWYAAT